MGGDALYKTTCPHCGVNNMGFTSVAQIPMEGGRSHHGSFWNVFFICNGCREGLVVKVHSSADEGPAGLPDHTTVPGKGWGRNKGEIDFLVIDAYPKPPTHLAPDHVPDRVGAAYIEASENLHRQKFETSEMLNRKALDLATKRLLPESKKPLYGRIEELRDTNKITVEMADWAHIVRNEGNDSVHGEEETTQEDAAELLAFTETFLMYAFTLPGMIAKRRLSAESEPSPE